MRAKKYIQMDVDATFPLMKTFKTACCDCGLVHGWTFVSRDGKFEFNVRRDNLATAKIRQQNDKAQISSGAR